PPMSHRRYRHRRELRGHSGAFAGIALLLVGSLLLLDALNLVAVRDLVRTYWPALLVGWGLSQIAAGRREWFWPLLAIAAGSLLLGNQLLGWHVRVWTLFWPVILIAMGLQI